MLSSHTIIPHYKICPNGQGYKFFGPYENKYEALEIYKNALKKVEKRNRDMI